MSFRALFFVLVVIFSAEIGEGATISGTWRFNKQESTDIAAWGRRVPYLTIGNRGDAVSIVQEWMYAGRESWIDSFTVYPGGGLANVRIQSPIWPENWFMGVLARIETERTTTATWLEPQVRLMTETEMAVEVSQGSATISSTCEYALGRDGDSLTLTERRSSRPTPVVLAFDRVTAGTGE